MELAWTATHDDGVSLVRCRLVNDDGVAKRGRLRSRLAGPVLPPRRRGVPESEWDAGGAAVRLESGASRSLGFAVAAPLEEPPVELVDVEPDPAGDATTDESNVDVADAVRELGGFRPPRAAVASGVTNGTDGDEREVAGADHGSGAASAADGDADRVGPASVDGWLDAVERRVERAERLTDADVATATEVMTAAGGADAVVELDERLARDAERLRELRDRAASLSERAAATDVPTDALERLS